MSRDVLVIHTCYTRLRPPDLFESCVSLCLCMVDATCLGIILIHVWCPVTRDTCGVWCPYRVGLVRHVWPCHRCIGGILPCNFKVKGVVRSSQARLSNSTRKVKSKVKNMCPKETGYTRETAEDYPTHVSLAPKSHNFHITRLDTTHTYDTKIP